ncbi:UDP-2,3-diacylglucosamine diphosphatase LpxI [Aurantimonas sp. Leaf443]|uniref:LpxI family protein n=1 Tax=Aurantimonas sp. Leaf443 TaxID=1736378 RepID=UPI0006FEB828|nr:UDP-2,3-diacylglucosamine diphosphatase LpxI [Aurantimonas sp. Leaf443]KQT83446.1 hypothetical protein ASG48_12880 [Aurantimonas sp. Leaf443]
MTPERPGEPLGILAGGGSLPRIVADAAQEAGFAPIVVRIADAIDEVWDRHETYPYAWGRAGDALTFLKARSVRRLVFCGTVTKRPDFRALRPSLRTLLHLPSALRIVRGGDDSLLRRLASFLGAHGFELVPVQAVAPRLLAPGGRIAGPPPAASDAVALALANEAARRLGSLDIGQAVVASADRVIALEGIEGTRDMLKRVAALRVAGRIGRHERAVLVKACKPAQDLRFDLPSIGASTIGEAASAGLVGIGVTAERALLIDLEDLRARAESAGLFVLGLGDDADPKPESAEAPR